MTSQLLAITISLATLGTSVLAQAQQPIENAMLPRFYADAQLGLFGDATLSNSSGSSTDSLEPSFGGIVGIEVPVVRHFSLGAEVGATVWNTDHGDRWDVDPSVLAHASFVPRVRLPWGQPGMDSHGAVYLGGMVGPTLSFISGDVQNALASIGGHVDMGTGLHLGAMAGVQVFPVRDVGFDFQVGYMHHFIWHFVNGPFGSGGDVQLQLGQLMLRGGIVVAF